MGVYTYIGLYKKDKGLIKSENTVLGIYQVPYEAKDSFALKGYRISFYGGIRSLDKLRVMNLDDMDIYEDYYQKFMFYALAIGEYGQTVKMIDGQLECLLFDPSRVLEGVEFLHKLIELGCFGEEDIEEFKKYGEDKLLIDLRSMLVKAIEIDALVSCATA
jgi:hypothetical protein